MMTDNELDNLFKNTLGNHEAPIPANMWQRIRSDDIKKRPIAFWWKWYAAAAVLLIAGMATWWYAAHITPASNQTATTHITDNKKENNPQTIPDTTGDIDNKDASLQRNNAPTTTNESNTNQPANDNKQQSIASSYSDKEKESSQRNKDLPSVTSDERQNNTAKNNDKPAADNTINNNEIAKPQTSPNLSETKQENKPATAGDNAALTVPNANAIAKNVDSAAATATNSKKDNKKQKHPWSIEIFASSAFADKQTYDIAKENTLGFAAAPIPPPQPKPSLWNYGAGVRLGIPVAKKVVLKTGLQFNQTRQKAAYQQQNVVDMAAVNGANDTTFYRQLIYQTENQNSTFNAVSVPVLISYQTGKKIQVGATAGVIVNAYSWYNGKVPNGTYSATLDAKDTYKNNTGVALYAGITASKKIGNVEVFAEPHLQYSLSNFTKPAVPFKQKINTYGLSIGVRTRLHK